MRWLVLLALLISGPAFAQEKPPVIDPTENVKALSEAANKRQDDLRIAESALNELRYANLKEVMALRSEYEEKIRKGEAGRLDALRLFDTNNVASALATANATASALAKKGDDAALVLSANVTKSADDIRVTVKTTADEQARNLATQLAGIQTQFTAISARLSSLESNSVNTSGVGSGRSDVVGWVQSGLILIVGFGGLLLAFMRKTGK